MGGGKTIWNNYPYSDPAPFLEKSVEGMRGGSFVAALGKYDPTTRWFKDWVLPYASVRILTDRVHFHLGGKPTKFKASFVSALFIFNPRGSADQPRTFSYWKYAPDTDPILKTMYIITRDFING